jgi:hypothetical protein
MVSYVFKDFRKSKAQQLSLCQYKQILAGFVVLFIEIFILVTKNNRLCLQKLDKTITLI